MSSQLLILGRYATELTDKGLLGQGSMGDVYLGLDIETEQKVAVKVLKRDVVRRNPDVVQRFLREGEALRQLNHPNIIQLLAAEEKDGRYYLVMNYAAGGSLQDLLDRQNQLPIPQALNIGLELADALARAHHIGIIHRDLKPANILLDHDGSVRLTDFGMARMTDRSRLTGSDVVVGTVKYLSPEACNGHPPDNRTDIWALGIVLFEMLTGKSPFLGDNMGATLHAILTQPVPDLQELRPEIPPELALLTYQMLEKEHNRRLSSARQAGATLEKIATDLKSEIGDLTPPVETQAASHASSTDSSLSKKPAT
jgi:serine/threonine-protein kinase